MSIKGQSVQDFFVNQLRSKKVNVHVYLVNGIKLIGTICSFDQYIVLLRNQDTTQLVFKHAISTIVPVGRVDLKWYHDHHDSGHASIKDEKDDLV